MYQINDKYICGTVFSNKIKWTVVVACDPDRSGITGQSQCFAHHSLMCFRRPYSAHRKPTN